jgi:hypothetical protein
MAGDESDQETLGHSNENSPVRDGGEKGENGEKKQRESSPVGFWHKDLKRERGKLFKKWAITSE